MDKYKTEFSDLIVKCSKEATKKPESSKFISSLKELVIKLKESFNSDYCAIGTVDEKYVTDRACTLDGLTKDVKRAPIISQLCLVCKALGYSYNDTFSRQLITTYYENDIRNAGNYEKYSKLLKETPKNTTIIIIQDDDGDPQGYLQFINSENEINEDDFEPFKTNMLKLACVLKQWYALEDERSFLKDFNFINGISGDTNNNVDVLLSKIMEYLSTEFNAGVISYRIPLLVGINQEPVFFLRYCFVNKKIGNRENVKKLYYKDRLIKTIEEMGGADELICKNHDRPVIPTEPTDSGIQIGISQEGIFKKNVVIIPIIRDHSRKEVCINKDRSNNTVLCSTCQNCIARFKKYFGIFKLRILKGEDEDEDNNIPDEVTRRLHNLAKHISVLLNAIVDKEENDSLKTFQTGLNDSAFTGINEFDQKCVDTIKESTRAKECAIFKFDKLSNDMVLRASTSKIIKLEIEGSEADPYFDSNLEKTMDGFGSWFPLEKDVINQVFDINEPVYYVGKERAHRNSFMMVPMMKKDGTRLGMILLNGKNMNEEHVSNTYWEQDKKTIKFMIDILSRIEESDVDRLVFLLTLSHELRKPITEMVYLNDFLQSTSLRNIDNVSKKDLLKGLSYNMNSCMMFKQIIGDIETTYFMRKGIISYDPKDENIKTCLLDVIRLFEQGGWSSEKKLIFDTRLSQMPQTMYVDKERIKQVFVNLLKNAIQYSDNYSTITISYSFNDSDDCHEIDFRNYGIGVAKEEEESIFKLWKRGESAKKKRPNGTGMGLSIVKEIMEVHGGRCYVKRLNNPTIFTVSIPKKHND